MHSLCYFASKALIFLLLSPFVRLRVVHQGRMRRAGALILATNHISHFDPPILTWSSPRKIDWMAMAELFQNALIRLWLRGVETFPVNRGRPDRAAIRTAIDRLEQGHVVGMFPEGGIRDGDSSILGGAAMRPGIGAIAQMSGAPVIPCVVLGTDRMYCLRNWIPFRRAKVFVIFGETMACEEGREGRERFESELALTMRALCQELFERFQLHADDMPQPAQRRMGHLR